MNQQNPDFPYLDNEEFSNRLHDKLMACTPSTLTRYLLDFAYEEISEEFNNEIIEEWESERRANIAEAIDRAFDAICA